MYTHDVESVLLLNSYWHKEGGKGLGDCTILSEYRQLGDTLLPGFSLHSKRSPTLLSPWGFRHTIQSVKDFSGTFLNSSPASSVPEWPLCAPLRFFPLAWVKNSWSFSFSVSHFLAASSTQACSFFLCLGDIQNVPKWLIYLRMMRIKPLQVPAVCQAPGNTLWLHQVPVRLTLWSPHPKAGEAPCSESFRKRSQDSNPGLSGFEVHAVETMLNCPYNLGWATDSNHLWIFPHFKMESPAPWDITLSRESGPVGHSNPTWAFSCDKPW